MEIKIQLDPIRNFVIKNWFKLSLLSLLLFFALRTDTIKINLGGGDKPFLETSPRESITKSSTEAATEAGVLSGWGIESNSQFLAIAAMDEAVKKNYLKRFAKVAIQEQQKFGIPASVMLSTALLQSEAGTRSLSVSSFNHFGLPCSEGWSGKKMESEGCFRVYDSAWGSFRDFSKFVAQAVGTAKPASGDVNAADWLGAMLKSGVLSGTADVNNLKSIIEKYNLAELDAMAKGE